MLLVLDVGNTNTVLGVYELATDGADKNLRRACWRTGASLPSRPRPWTSMACSFRNLFSFGKN